MKARTSLKLGRRSPSNVVEFAHTVVQAMTGNANFLTPVPALSVVAQAASDLDNAISNTQMNTKMHTALVKTSRQVLHSVLSLLALYVDLIAQGDESVILSAGMDASSYSRSSSMLLPPASVTATSTTTEGAVEVAWSKVANAHAYVIELSDGSAATGTDSRKVLFITWSIADVITKTHVTLPALQSGIKYAIRVYAVGARGKSATSTPVVVKVL